MFVSDGSGDFTLTADELRVVAGFVSGCAERVLSVFEDEHPDDPRPRDALGAARAFVEGERRTKLQRTTSLDAHRAAKDATTESATLAARAAGDAASSAYLHPISKATQVGHILRAAACAARIAELQADDDPGAGAASLAWASRLATPTLINVLCRYPPAPVGPSRVAQLMSELDSSLRRRDPRFNWPGPPEGARPLSQ